MQNYQNNDYAVNKKAETRSVHAFAKKMRKTGKHKKTKT